MSMFDEDAPRKKKTHEIGQDLSLLSVDDLSGRNCRRAGGAPAL